MQSVIRAFAFIGVIAVAYYLGKLIGKAFDKLAARSKAKISQKAAHVIRIDELERAVDELKRLVGVIQDDVDALSQADLIAQIETIATAVNVQRKQLEKLAVATHMLTRRVNRIERQYLEGLSAESEQEEVEDGGVA